MSRLYCIATIMQDDKIFKYLNEFASSDEEKEVEHWILSSEENTKKFNLVKAKYIASTLAETRSTVQIEKEFSKFKNTLRKKLVRKLPTYVLKYAAIVIITFGTGYLLTNIFFSNDSPLIIPENSITLELEDGIVKIISEGITQQIVNSKGSIIGTQQGEKLVYMKNTTVEELVYNTLTVPYGKRFNISLSDGTQILLNSGTSIKYPVKFIQGKERQVFLTGEAFFNVAKDSEHPFIVNADNLNIQALGTQFNVSSYPEDSFSNTVLVKGSVSVYNNDISDEDNVSILTPGHKALWNKIDKDISVEKVDVLLYTAWINGKIVFRHIPFKNIIKKLERYYNVKIINHNKLIDNEMFSASFDVETIEEVFKTFKKTYDIHYVIDNNQIIIN